MLAPPPGIVFTSALVCLKLSGPPGVSLVNPCEKAEEQTEKVMQILGGVGTSF